MSNKLTRLEVLASIENRIAQVERVGKNSYILRSLKQEVSAKTSREDLLEIIRKEKREVTSFGGAYDQYTYVFGVVSKMEDEEDTTKESLVQLSRYYKLPESVIRVAIEDAVTFGHNRGNRALAVLSEELDMDYRDIMQKLKSVYYMKVPHTNNQWYREASDGLTTTPNKTLATSMFKEDWETYFTEKEIEKYMEK